MQRIKKETGGWAFARLAVPVWLIALCFALAPCSAIAQPVPPKKESIKNKKAQSSPSKARPSSGAIKSGVKSQKASGGKEGADAGKGGGCGSGKKKSNADPLVPDANAKWSCENTTVNLGDVWAGGAMEFVFKIKNEGTANLRYKAKGG